MEKNIGTSIKKISSVTYQEKTLEYWQFTPVSPNESVISLFAEHDRPY
jgi:hypothetical protein